LISITGAVIYSGILHAEWRINVSLRARETARDSLKGSKSP
jgi:hypothetical protein